MNRIWGGSDEPRSVTEYKTEYKSHDATNRRQPFKPDAEYKSFNGPIQDETTHKYFARHSLSFQRCIKEAHCLNSKRTKL